MENNTNGANATTDQNNNLPAITGDNMPATTAAASQDSDSMEFSETELDQLFTAIRVAEKVDLTKTEKIRIDAPYREFTKEDEGKSIIRMVAGYSWANSTFSPDTKVACVSLYDVQNKCFERVMQTALTGKMIDKRIPKGTMVDIEYIGKVKGSNGYQYQDFKICVLIAKVEAPAPAEGTEAPAAADEAKTDESAKAGEK